MASVVLSAALSLPMISGDVPAGARIPNQVSTE